ncbi:PHP domain-containing protein, partial [bacterium]|nr:PHP domain-containing protein [bacterium]
MSFVELHSSSYFSFLSASSSPEDLAMVAKDQGLPAIALSDYSGLYGVIPFYNKCKELGIKAIIASVLILENGDKISLICKNQKAYEDLCLLITLSRKGQEKGISTTSYQILSEHSENFIVLLAFKSSLLYDLIISNSSKEANQLLDQYLEIFDKNCIYFELNHHKEKDDRKHCNLIYDFARNREIECVASNGVHYAKKENAKLQDILVCIKNKTNLRESHHIRFSNHERYIKSHKEMTQLFKVYPNAISNTQKIADQCNVDLDFTKYRFPDFPVSEGYDINSYLRHLCLQALSKKYSIHLLENESFNYEDNGSENLWIDLNIKEREVLTRLNFELDIIQKRSLSGYFLLVWDIVQFSLQKKIPAQGRGSAANSLVAYLLDITPVCPIKHNLFFGRFLN